MKKEMQKIRNLILLRFVYDNAKNGRFLGRRWFIFELKKQLNEYEFSLIEEVVQQMVEGELITSSKDGIYLSKKGFELIYPIDEIKVKFKIRNLILEEFKNINARPNYILPPRTKLFEKINPRELEYFDTITNELIKEEIVGELKNNLFLTEKGFNLIYGKEK